MLLDRVPGQHFDALVGQGADRQRRSRFDLPAFRPQGHGVFCLAASLNRGPPVISTGMNG